VGDEEARTLTPLPCPAGPQYQGYLTHNHLPQIDATGQKLPELISTFDKAQMPIVVDEIDRQVLSDVEVNC